MFAHTPHRLISIFSSQYGFGFFCFVCYVCSRVRVLRRKKTAKPITCTTCGTLKLLKEKKAPIATANMCISEQEIASKFMNQTNFLDGRRYSVRNERKNWKQTCAK